MNILKFELTISIKYSNSYMLILRFRREASRVVKEVYTIHIIHTLLAPGGRVYTRVEDKSVNHSVYKPMHVCIIRLTMLPSVAESVWWLIMNNATDNFRVPIYSLANNNNVHTVQSCIFHRSNVLGHFSCFQVVSWSS